MPNTPRLHGTPPPPSAQGDAQIDWARGRLERLSSELRDLSARAARSLPGATSFDDGTTWGLAGFFKFQVEPAQAALWFELLGRPVDAVVFSASARGFVLRSEPSRALEPLGFLRGRVLEIVSAAGGGRFSSQPPAAMPSTPPPKPDG